MRAVNKAIGVGGPLTICCFIFNLISDYYKRKTKEAEKYENKTRPIIIIIIKGYINSCFKVRKGHALPCGERFSCSLKISRSTKETAALVPVNQTWGCCWTPRQALGISLLQHSGPGAVQDFKSLLASLFASTSQRPKRGKVFGNSCARQMGGRNGAWNVE